jgi:hypothetical protein
MYEAAIANAEKTGDGGKARRYKRGLKVQNTTTLEYIILFGNQIINQNLIKVFRRLDQHYVSSP